MLLARLLYAPASSSLSAWLSCVHRVMLARSLRALHSVSRHTGVAQPTGLSAGLPAGQLDFSAAVQVQGAQ